MPVRENLVLDHFYIDASADDFDALKNLLNVFSGISHQSVKTQDDSWEGIYLYSRPGSYFEILRDRRKESLGICQSPNLSHYVDASKIMGQVDLEWHTLERKQADGTPWFDALSVSAKPFQPTTLFDAWIMKYHPSHKETPTRMKPRSVDRFVSMNLTLGRNHVDEIKRLSEWFSGKREITESHIRFEIPDRDGRDFVIEADLVDGDQRFKFRELRFQHFDREFTKSFEPLKMNTFTLLADGGELVLSRA